MGKYVRRFFPNGSTTEIPKKAMEIIGELGPDKRFSTGSVGCI